MGHQPSELALADRVRFLGDPTAYGGEGPVQALETHWSWVFLTPSRVFKLKKPTLRPWMDLRSLSAREANCREELRLNQRLTESIYLRVHPLRQGSDGRLTIGGEGVTVDWLVEMKRLPREHMLDFRLKRGEVADSEVSVLGKRLADFYSTQTPVVADGSLYLTHLQAEAAENRRVLLDAEIGLPLPWREAILDGVDRLLLEVTPAIETRISRGKVIEGHGDLRPEHICLVDPIAIFDCLEFDRGMRILDPFDEVNYLGLECAFLGARWLRPRLLAVLGVTIGCRPKPRLMSFYSAFRATLRARICLAHLDDEVPMEPSRWPRDARAYLRLAEMELGGS